MARWAWGQVLYRYWHADPVHRGTWAGPFLCKDESFLCLCSSQMGQHVRGWWLGSLQLTGHRGPESILTVCSAKTERIPSYRVVHERMRAWLTTGKQQISSVWLWGGSFESWFTPIWLNTLTKLFIMNAAFSHRASPMDHLGSWVPSLTLDGVESNTLSSTATTSSSQRTHDNTERAASGCDRHGRAWTFPKVTDPCMYTLRRNPQPSDPTPLTGCFQQVVLPSAVSLLVSILKDTISVNKVDD